MGGKRLGKSFLVFYLLLFKYWFQVEIVVGFYREGVVNW